MTKLADFKVEPGTMRQQGLMFWVTMQPIPSKGASTVAPFQARALIDTGSEVCGISPTIAAKLTDSVRTDRNIWTPTHGHSTEPALRARITFADGTSRELDFSIIKELEPHEVLIGRDVLSEMKLAVDFKSGSFTLEWA